MRPIFPNTIAEAARLIEAGDLSPVELVDALLSRISSLDPVINAFITVTADQARTRARRVQSEINKGHYRGPLHGIPYGAKDVFETAGVLTTGQSKVYSAHVPHVDAAAIAKLDEAGAILMGKLATHELAHGGPSFDLAWPPARNPWNPLHFTGGSSSGSAAAVAAGLVLGSLGTDAGGSILIPASLCGLVGMKPTFGLVSRHGVLPNAFSLDHCGPIARTVEDCAILLDAIVGPDPRDRSSVDRPLRDFRADFTSDLRGVRIGVVRQFGEEPASPNEEMRRAIDETLRILTDLGATLHDVRLRPLRDYYDVWTIIEAPETFAIQRSNLIERPNDFGSVFLVRTLIACLIDASDYVAAQRARTGVVREIELALSSCDVLVAPGAGPAPELGPGLAAWPNPNRFVPFTLAGNPMLGLCIGFSRGGMPMGMQFIGKPFEDPQVLGIARAYEQATAWSQCRAPITTEAKQAPITYNSALPTMRDIDPEIVDLCIRATTRAGLHLPERPLILLCEAAPRMLEMLGRLRRMPPTSFDPSNIFFAS